MMLEGDWLVSQLENSSANLGDYGMFPFPTNTQRLYGFASTTTSAPRAQIDLAAKFLDYFLSTKGPAGSSARSARHRSTRTSSMPDEAAGSRMARRLRAYGKVYMNGDQAFPRLKRHDRIFRVINDVAAGNLAPADAAKQLQTFWPVVPKISGTSVSPPVGDRPLVNATRQTHVARSRYPCH